MKKRVHIKSQPHNIQRIVDKSGIILAAQSLGITPTAIKKYIKEQKAPQATEMAAQMVFEMGALKQKTAIIKGEQEALDMFQKIAEISKVNFSFID